MCVCQYSLFPFLHWFHPSHFPLCQCIPRAKSSGVVKNSQFSSEQLIISGWGVQECFLYKNVTTNYTPWRTGLRFAEERKPWVWTRRELFLWQLLPTPPHILSADTSTSLLPLVIQFTVKTQAATTVCFFSCAPSSHPAAQTSWQTCHTLSVSFLLLFLVKTVSCTAVPQLCRRQPHSTKLTHFSETLEDICKIFRQYPPGWCKCEWFCATCSHSAAGNLTNLSVCTSPLHTALQFCARIRHSECKLPYYGQERH